MDNGFNKQVGDWLTQLQQGKQPAKYPNPSTSIKDEIAALPNSQKLTPFEKWTYQKLPGFSQSGIGKALEKFGESPAGKLLQWLDIGAEGLERGLGVIAQYRDKQPGEDFNFKDAWTAGSIFYDTVRVPKLKWGEDGSFQGIEVDMDAPGAYAVTEARKLIEQGKSLEEVRGLLYGNLGALALRAQMKDTLGHIFADPLNWALAAVKPVERLHALRNLALAGKVDVQHLSSLEKTFKAAGQLEDASKIAGAIEDANKTGRAMTRFERFAIAATGGVPWLSKEEGKLQKIYNMFGKINPLALTPQAKASELLDMVASNVGEHLIRPLWNAEPEEFIKSLSSAARGGIGDEWGHLALTIEGRTTQGFLSGADAQVRVLGKQWTTYAEERKLLQIIASGMPGMDERKLWQFAKKSPASLFQRIIKASGEMGGELLAEELKKGTITEEIINRIAKMSNDIPLLKEEFYAKAMVTIQDTAMQHAILQFGIKEKGVLTKWSDALKAWESLPFIKANPANAIRNVVNNDITLIGRGLFGTMTDATIAKMWKGKWIPPQFQRAFGFGVAGEGVENLEKFNPGNAIAKMNDVLEGSGGLAGKVKNAANQIDLKAFDFSKWSQEFERRASIRASTMGWLEFHQKYWNPKTGFTSVKKVMDAGTLEEMERIMPGISDILDDIAESSGADSAKFAELMQAGVEQNVSSIIKNTSERLGYKLDDVLGTDTVHAIQEGLPQAIKEGKVPQFVDNLRATMESHVDEMFNQHLENLPGIIAAQVQAGGQLQYHRIFAKSLDEFWGGNVEHAMRMSTMNDAIDYARSTGDYTKVQALWKRIAADSDTHFGRVWKKFDAYQQGLEEGAKLSGVKYPKELRQSFAGIKSGWSEFFDFRKTEYEKLFSTKGDDFGQRLEKLQAELDNRFAKMTQEEDRMMQQVDDLMVDALPDATQAGMYRNFRDTAAQLRLADRTNTTEFFKSIRGAVADDVKDMWQTYWQDRMGRLEQMRQLEMRGSAALQGDSQSIGMFLKETEQTGEETIYSMANRYGIASATTSGARNDRRILNTINKHLPEGVEKFKKLEDVPMDIAKQALDTRQTEKVGQVTDNVRQFIPDAEKLLPDPLPIETAISEMNYGRGYAAIDALMEEASDAAARAPRLVKELPEALQKKVAQWSKRVDDEMSSFRSAGVQYAAFRRDSALLNYNRRNNFDSFIGNIAPFAFWSTHSMANWAIYSMDRPAMLTNAMRMKKFFETAGLPDQNVPQRLKGHIRVNLPFTPDWMGDTFVNPGRFLLPFDGFLMPWEQMQSSKLQKTGKVKDTLNSMLEQGQISEEQYQQAIETQDGEFWDAASAQVDEGGDNYDAMDFMNMTMTPHAPLMWAYNAVKGTPEDIGPFTPLSRTARNVATMFGVKDWSNSPYNVEGRIRKEMGLPAYDKWDDYRVGRSISNLAASGEYGMDEIKQAMQTAALVEAGKMTSADAVKQDKLYALATERANQEFAGGWAGTVLGALGIPVKAYPEGEQSQRELGDQFSAAMEARDNGDVDALTDFFDEHPEYEARLALFKKPEERLKSFMVDHMWSRWNEMPEVNQKELKEFLGDEFANKFLSKETKDYDSITPEHLQMWLKLAGAKPVGSLSAEVDAMLELNKIRFTDPETAWRVETFYQMRTESHPDWYKLQNAYYALPEGKRQQYLAKNPGLREYWDDRKRWMNNNPDLVRFLTDDEKQLAKYAKMKRNPEVAVPNAQEIRAQMSPAMMELMQDWQGGQPLPYSLDGYLNQLAQEYGIEKRELAGILTGQGLPE